MLQRILIIADPSVDDATFAETRDWAEALSTALQEPLGIARVGKNRLRVIRTALLSGGGAERMEAIVPPPPKNAAMGSADFLWREDGRPDWAEMWTGFCELALYGGPPHRGDEAALHAPDPEAVVAAEPAERPWDGFNPINEIRRGIWETTGLFAEPADDPGWITVTCDSRKMAAWLCACIILENVDARADEERLYLPAGSGFHLKNEVKSVITVLAKCHHYWQAHIEAQTAGAPITNPYASMAVGAAAD
ncbi:MAG: hypothetical protein HYX51_02390 [Chloroflexi bacterium]|nr:hypothetical protein [Chloroflexota bacterium]